VARQKNVHAIHGSWSCVRADDGTVLCYEGKFHLKDREHAQGTARYLAHANISKGYLDPLKNNDNQWVVKVWQYDNIKKFEQWDRFSELLPDVAKEHSEAIQLRELQSWQEKIKKQNASRFKPLPKRMAEDVAKKLPWQAVEVGRQQTFVWHTSHPVLAMQMAIFLCREGFISDQCKQRVSEEAKHYMNSNDKPPADWSIAISIDHAKAAIFFERFLADCNPGSKISESAIASIQMLSFPSNAAQRIAG
jgi:hypothetical protein